MKRTFLIIIIAIFLLAGAGFYFYTYHYSPKKLTAWEVIPDDALIVYERGECQSCVEEVQQSSVWKIISEASFYGEPADSLRSNLMNDLQSTPDLLISLHAIKKDDFDFVFYLDDRRSLSGFEKIITKPFYRRTEREFNGVKIYETSFSRQTFSWALIKNLWVGSFTPFLIEDVIRTSVKKDGSRKDLSQLKQMPRISDDAGNIYIKLGNFSGWLSLFYAQKDFFRSNLAQSAVLDIKNEENTLVLNGFSAEDASAGISMLSVFHNQSPVSFNLKNIISSRTIALQSFGVSNGVSFMNDMYAYRKKMNASVQDSLVRLEQTSKVNADVLYQKIHDEVNICFTESNRGNKLSKVLIVETEDTRDWINALDKISAALSKDTIFYEKYGDHEIREVPVYNFPEKIFWPLVTDFPHSYYTSVGNAVLIGEDLDDLKAFLTDVDEDNTWGKSVIHNKFLETTLLESSLSLYVNTPLIWNYISKKLHPRWGEFLKTNDALIRSIQMTAFQFSHLNNTFYTNVSINHRKFTQVNKNSLAPDRYISNFSSPLRGLYGVRSHVNRRDEILVQDSLNDLTLVSGEGKVLWKVPVGEPITSEVSQIDYFANGKLQYFFTTQTALHVLDRMGNYVEPFPVTVKPGIIERAKVIDYDHSKKYRFLIAMEGGQLWMFDKEGNNLDGWRPKYIYGDLLTEPRHHRVKGKDYIIAVRKDGVIYLMNRRGEDVKGFPLKLETALAGDYFLENGNTINDTYFVVVSNNGYRIRFNITGKVQSKEALLKTTFNTQFALIREKSDKSYLVMRQDSRGFSLVDESGKVVISNDAIGTNEVDVNYYDFGSGKKYVSVADKAQELTYVYGPDGELVTSPPVETSILGLRPSEQDQIRLFFIQGNALNIQAF